MTRQQVAECILRVTVLFITIVLHTLLFHGYRHCFRGDIQFCRRGRLGQVVRVRTLHVNRVLTGLRLGQAGQVGNVSTVLFETVAECRGAGSSIAGR